MVQLQLIICVCGKGFIPVEVEVFKASNKFMRTLFSLVFTRVNKFKFYFSLVLLLPVLLKTNKQINLSKAYFTMAVYSAEYIMINH